MAYSTTDDPSAYFKVQLYTGDGGTTQAITFNDTDTNMQPDWVWIKMRSEAQSNILVDSVRGANKYLGSNHNGAEGTDINSVTAFGSDGFTVGNDDSVNKNTGTYVSWNWKESATAGFDIVSYTGNGTSGATVNHGLGVAPNWYMVKRRSTTGSWYMYHSANTSAPATDFLYLNENYATEDGVQAWNDTAPTSSVFSLGDNENVNANTSTYIAYLWAQKKGFSKFGSYTGNGNADGTFVYTGFRPAWVVIKRTDASANWVLLDNKRDPFNGMATVLNPNDNAADNDMTDGSGNKVLDMLSNGFKIRDEYAEFGGSGATYIYMAFAESPFVNSNKVPTNAR